MTNFTGKAINDTVVEYYGPVTGRNYNTAGAAAPVVPAIHAQVRGGGAIQLQETQTFIMKGNVGGNVFTHDKLPDGATWVNLGPVITSGTPLVTVNPTVDSSFSAIRAIVVTTSITGHATIQSDWN